MNKYIFASIAALAVAVPVVAGCSRARCDSDDFACLMSHFEVYDADGNQIKMTSIDGSKLDKAKTHATGSGGAGGFPSGSSSTGTGFGAATTTSGSSTTSGTTSSGGGPVPPSVGVTNGSSFDFSPDSYAEVDFHFTDPSSCQRPIIGCFPVPKSSKFPGSYSTVGPIVASPPVNDGLTSGDFVWQATIDADVPTDIDADMNFVAISTPCGSSDDPDTDLDDSDNVAVGAPISVEFTVSASLDDSSTGGAGCPTCAELGESESEGRPGQGCCVYAGGCPAACTDYCGQNGWYEVNGTPTATCPTSDSGCVQGIADEAVHECNPGN